MANYKEGQFESDPEKAKSRGAFRTSIERTFTGKEREDGKVLFLTGDSLAEYKQVYSPSGFRPQNVYGVERDRDTYQRAFQQNAQLPPEKRINLYHGSVEDFFNKNPRKRFDVVNLDFNQNYGTEMSNCFNAVFGLSDKSLISVGMTAKRESPLTKKKMGVITLLGMPLILENISEGKIKRMSYLNKEEADYFLGELFSVSKDIGLDSRELLELTRYGSFVEIMLRAKFPVLFIHKPLKRLKEEGKLEEIVCQEKDEFLTTLFDASKNYESNVLDILREVYRGENFQDNETIMLDNLKKIYFEFGEILSEAGRHLNLEKYPSNLINILRKHVSFNEEIVKKIGPFNMSIMAEYMVSKKITGYETNRYVSASGNPMINQMFWLDSLKENADKIMEGYERFLKEVSNTNFPRGFLEKITKDSDFAFFFNLDKMPKKVLQGFRGGQRIINSMNYLNREFYNFQMREREIEFMRPGFVDFKNELLDKIREMKQKIEASEGSSKKQIHVEIPKSTESPEPIQIDTSKIWQMHISGKSPEEIHESDIGQGFSVNNLRKICREIPDEEKEAIRELHRNGSSPKEIYEVMYSQTLITQPQISAVCAWNKIRDNKKSD